MTLRNAIAFYAIGFLRGQLLVRVCALTFMLLALCLDVVAMAGDVSTVAPVVGVRVVARLPHDEQAFTQGLFFSDGRLYETTGRRGASNLRELNPDTGRVVRSVALAPRYFGEGATAVDGRAVWLTWTSGRAFSFDLGDLSPGPKYQYHGQGWGLAWDGARLVMSNGTPELVFRDPQSFEPVSRLVVHDGAQPVHRLNELEWVDGELWANVWLTARVAVIDPVTGRVRRWIDLSPLVPTGENPNSVANGIAWDSATGRLLVTGKLWPVIYVIEPLHEP